MKMRKLLASVLAGALAISAMAVATSAATITKSGASTTYSVNLSATFTFAKQAVADLKGLSLGASANNGAVLTLTDKSDATKTINVKLSDVKVNGAAADTGNYIFGFQNGKDQLVKQDYTSLVWTAKGTVDGADYGWAHGSWEPFDAAAGWGYKFSVVEGTKQLANLVDNNIVVTLNGQAITSDVVTATEVTTSGVSGITGAQTLNDGNGLKIAEQADFKAAKNVLVTVTFDALSAATLVDFDTDLTDDKTDDAIEKLTNYVAKGATTTQFVAPAGMFYTAPDAEYGKGEVYFTTYTVTAPGAKVTEIKIETVADGAAAEDTTAEDTEAPEDTDEPEEDVTDEPAEDVEPEEEPTEEPEEEDEPEEVEEPEEEDPSDEEDGTEIETPADTDAEGEGEGTDAEAGADTDADNAGADAAGDKNANENPATGVALAVLPAIIAAGAVVASRKRK